MNIASRSWIRKAAALIVVFLVALAGTRPGFGTVRDHGKEISVQKRDGQVIKGELIAVKNTTLLIDSKASSENSIDFSDISSITIIKKSQFLSGLGLGVLIGTVGGGWAGLLSGDSFDPHLTAPQQAMIAGIGLGVIGGTIGGIVGAIAGADETIKISEPRNPYKTAWLLDKIRSLSRFPDEK
jgi:hypothetical protein